MAHRRDLKGALRGALAMREIERARVSCQSGAAGTLVRVALALIFMFLIAISHSILGDIGPVFVSVLFIVALLVPYLYEVSRDLLERRSARKESSARVSQSPKKG